VPSRSLRDASCNGEERVPRRFEVEGIPVSVVRTEQEVFAIHDVCLHSAVSLSEGQVDGYTASWLHASRLDLRTGPPLSGRTRPLRSGPMPPATAPDCWRRPPGWWTTRE
jgi:nitrite reductase/ring-hydroxylating ferredoxin subunit